MRVLAGAIQKDSSSLSIAEQQMLEIAKALASDAKIIVMGEPTSSLTTKEVNSLFKIIGRLTSENRTVIYISHHGEPLYAGIQVINGDRFFFYVYENGEE